MAVLSAQRLRDTLYHTDLAQRLVVSPLLDPSRQIGNATIDVRLGSEFLLFQQRRVAGLFTEPAKMFDRSLAEAEVKGTTSSTYIPIGEAFVLHPGQFVLTSTLEYVVMPKSLMAYVEGRSSWGRLGLIVATATMVAPGFRGAITFELVNAGSVPIGLYPGSRIAQLVFHKLDEPEPEVSAYGGKESKYKLPIGPEFSKISRDADWELLNKFRESEQIF